LDPALLAGLGGDQIPASPMRIIGAVR
jgi:hypothetical protein